MGLVKLTGAAVLSMTIAVVDGFFSLVDSASFMMVGSAICAWRPAMAEVWKT